MQPPPLPSSLFQPTDSYNLFVFCLFIQCLPVQNKQIKKCIIITLPNKKGSRVQILFSCYMFFKLYYIPLYMYYILSKQFPFHRYVIYFLFQPFSITVSLQLPYICVCVYMCVCFRLVKVFIRDKASKQVLVKSVDIFEVLMVVDRFLSMGLLLSFEFINCL